MNVYLIIVLTVIAIMVLVFGIALVITYRDHNKRLEELMRYEINVGAEIDEKIPKILDNYINEIFTEYRITNLEFKEKPNYINEEDEKKILRDVGTLCGDRLSLNMIDKLSLFWNPQEIGSIIADKVSNVVAIYVATTNSIDYQQNTTESNES